MYAEDDPVNYYDPPGLFLAQAGSGGGGGGGDDDDDDDDDDGGGYGSGGMVFSGGFMGGSGGGPVPGAGNQPPYGPSNPGAVTLSPLQQKLLGNVSFSSLTPAQQLVFLTITGDAAQLGVNLTGYQLSSSSAIWIAGAGENQTELNLTDVGEPGTFTDLRNSLNANFSGAGWDPFHHGGYGRGGNWRQNVPNWSMQITAQPGGDIQLDIDPNNPSLLGGDILSLIGYIRNVIRNQITGNDTNYTQVAAALMSRGIKVFNCPQ